MYTTVLTPLLGKAFGKASEENSLPNPVIY